MHGRKVLPATRFGIERFHGREVLRPVVSGRARGRDVILRLERYFAVGRRDLAVGRGLDLGGQALGAWGLGFRALGLRCRV